MARLLSHALQDGRQGIPDRRFARCLALGHLRCQKGDRTSRDEQSKALIAAVHAGTDVSELLCDEVNLAPGTIPFVLLRLLHPRVAGNTARKPDRVAVEPIEPHASAGSTNVDSRFFGKANCHRRAAYRAAGGLIPIGVFTHGCSISRGTVGTMTRRNGHAGLMPWARVTVACEHYAESGNRPSAHFLRGGVRLGFVWDP